MTTFAVRAAEPRDVPDLMRLKYLLAEAENSLHALSAGEADWLRDGFGPRAGFTAFVAETAAADNGAVVMGMEPAANASSPAGTGRCFSCRISLSKRRIAAAAWRVH